MSADIKHHPDMEVAKTVLRSQLQEAFEQSVPNCAFGEVEAFRWKVEGLRQYSGQPFITDAIEAWKRESLSRVKEGYELLLKTILKLQQHSYKDALEIAGELTGEVINEVFGWNKIDEVSGQNKADRSDARRFEEWFRRVDDEGFIYLVPGLSKECEKLKSLADQLSCEFKRRFENWLKVLRSQHEAFPATPAVSTEDTESAPTGREDQPFPDPSTPRSTAAVSSDSALAEGQTSFVFGSGYRAVTINGRKLRLTPNQALVVKKLHDAHGKGQAVTTKELLSEIGAPKSQLRDSFRSADGPELWKNWIARVGRGMYELKLPPLH